jgi:mono/diheme cytochrome c family protein
MIKFLAGIIFILLLLPVLVYFYFSFGYVPVATAASPMMFERTLAHIGLNAKIDKEAPKNAPFLATTDDLQVGVRLYREQCAMCHGIPDQPKSAIAQGMFPVPPQLFQGKGVTDDPAGETYWKIDNGIRLTGMPAYGKSLSDKQMWQISLLLAGADKLPAEVKETLKKPLPIEAL